MGNQIITQPQTFTAGITVLGNISATGSINGTGGSGGGSSALVQNVMTGNGGTTYTLSSYSNDTASNYLVFLDGVKQRATTDYSVSGSDIIFTSPVATGTVIEADVATSITSIAGGTVNSVGITTDGNIAVSNSPVTTSGNISLSLSNVPLSTIANLVTFPPLSTRTSYTLALSDNNNMLCFTAGVSGVVIIPTSPTFPVGFQTSVMQLSSGQITLSAALGSTLSNELSTYKTARQYGAASLLNLGTRWVCYGSLA